MEAQARQHGGRVLAFRPATKQKAKLRLALVGPPGSGKTMTALRIAKGLAPEGRIAVIDTERGSASKYADKFGFETLELNSFHPQLYVDAIHAAEQAGFDVIIIDSLSHAWNGKDGLLEQLDHIAARNRNASSFNAWKDATPIQNRLIDSILGAKAHVIVTMRVKTEYVQEKDERGKTVPKKLGLAPVQRDGVEYEFDVLGEIDQAHKLVISKSRCDALADAVIEKPGPELGDTLRVWLTDGSEPPAARAVQAPAPMEEGPPSSAAARPQPVKSAPPETGSDIEPETGASAAELRARLNRVWQYMKKGGKSGAEFRLWVSETLQTDKPSSGLTEAEVRILEEEAMR